MSAKQILLDAADIVEANPKAWIQGSSARDADGFLTDSESPNATCWCAIGITEKLGRGDLIAKIAARDALRTFAKGSIVTHNDEYTKSPGEFVFWFREAAELCE